MLVLRGDVMARKSLDELDRLDFWSLPEFARLKLARSKPWIYRRLEPDATGKQGVLHLPNGVVVPVQRDFNGFWTVSRHQYELAARAAADMKEAG